MADDFNLIDECARIAEVQPGVDPYDLATHVFYGMGLDMYLKGYRFDFARASSENNPDGSVTMWYPLLKDGERVTLTVTGARMEGKLVQKINVDV